MSLATSTKRRFNTDDAKELGTQDGQPPPTKRQRPLGSTKSLAGTNSGDKDSNSKIGLYCSWFCPFAQRAWIALLLKGIEFDYHEVDPYHKSKEWLAINPRGLVPAIIDYNADAKGKHIIYESTIILEYLDEEYPMQTVSSNDKSNSTNGSQSESGIVCNLFPQSSYKRAMARIWIDHVNKKVIRTFYQILQFREKEKQVKAAQDFFAAIDKLLLAMDDKGPFFDGTAMGAVDISLLPWAARLFLLKHYRDIDYTQYIGKSVSADGSDNKSESKEDGDACKTMVARYEAWWSACSKSEAFTATKADDKKLIAKYQRYADNTAKTEVAVAVNKGLPLP